jgi:hypothetical protein
MKGREGFWMTFGATVATLWTTSLTCVNRRRRWWVATGDSFLSTKLLFP